MEPTDKVTNTSCGNIDSCHASFKQRRRLAKPAGILRHAPCIQNCFARDVSSIFQDRLRLARGLRRNPVRCRHSFGKEIQHSRGLRLLWLQHHLPGSGGQRGRQSPHAMGTRVPGLVPIRWAFSTESPAGVREQQWSKATALVPPGSTITLNGQDCISSFTDPLHGAGSVDFRKASPGFTLGTGNVVSRTRSHLSIPLEIGFYYVGQPGLKVNFTGSACDPTLPAAIACESVDQDPGFQQNLAAFIARNKRNLSYASLFPIFSVGFGYAF
jgi:hypothetical protein